MFFFFFNDTASTEIYTLSLHDALPILFQQRPSQGWGTPEQVQDPVFATNAFYDALVEVDGYRDLPVTDAAQRVQRSGFPLDRKSTRLNSSHANISYAVFCLKKKIQNIS